MNTVLSIDEASNLIHCVFIRSMLISVAFDRSEFFFKTDGVRNKLPINVETQWVVRGSFLTFSFYLLFFIVSTLPLVFLSHFFRGQLPDRTSCERSSSVWILRQTPMFLFDCIVRLALLPTGIMNWLGQGPSTVERFPWGETFVSYNGISKLS